MKLGRKLLMTAKGISVWWGIYLILGCCIGFGLKTVKDLFMTAGAGFEIKLYIPIMGAGSLVLAVITYAAAAVLKAAPFRKMKRKLWKIVRTEGVSDNYISELFSNARGDMKNYLTIEAAGAYTVRGETERAASVLEKIDLVSVLDVAQSTGDFRTAAYYYCVKMIMCIQNKDTAGATRAYDEGIYYLEAFETDANVLLVLAVYQLEAGLFHSALDTIKKVKIKKLPPYLRQYGKSLSALITATSMLNTGRMDEAGLYAAMACEAPGSDFIKEWAENILNQTRTEKKAISETN
ncbi:MAG: hypothetical protein J6C96_04400 [Oscillospiraceae bacterium]|nr:hypothetical protein [Oscillospiraceae bacterium]